VKPEDELLPPKEREGVEELLKHKDRWFMKPIKGFLEWIIQEDDKIKRKVEWKKKFD